MSTCRRLLTAAALAGMAGAASAAPVDAESIAADPYDLAVRWTLASLSPLELASPPAAPAPVVRLSAVPHAGAASGVPDPGAYALMGLLLLGAGLLAQRLTAARGRGPRRTSTA
jgi:hypothetical protein